MSRMPVHSTVEAANSAPGSVFDAEVLAHMFGDHTEDEADEPAVIVRGRLADRFLQ